MTHNHFSILVAEKTVREARKIMSDLRSQRADAIAHIDRSKVKAPQQLFLSSKLTFFLKKKAKAKIESSINESESRLRRRSRER
jgi:hypothetical protein